MDAEPDTPEGDKLGVLATLVVEAYEEKHYPVGPPDPIEAIVHRIESQGLELEDLEPFIGDHRRVSEVKRSLSLRIIRKLQPDWEFHPKFL